MSCPDVCSEIANLPSIPPPALTPHIHPDSPSPLAEHDPQVSPAVLVLPPASPSSTLPAAAISPLRSTLSANTHNRHTAPPVPAVDRSLLSQSCCTTSSIPGKIPSPTIRRKQYGAC